ncbi:MAG: TonB-dependent receptor, partial [Acidobacteria bacterium]|nr:TonB-dependent receptor [Acidobacteriota bacterium]
NVVTSVPPAEFAVPANYTVATRGGTNEYHGSGFYTYNGNSLNSRNFFEPTTPFRVYNNFGASIGGPVKKNKLFFFMDYEGSREQARSLMVLDVPLQTWRNGNFAGQDTIVDPTNGKPFANNAIPAARISDVSRKVQQSIFPAANFGAATLESSNYRKTFPGVTGFSRFDMFDVRGDYNFSERDALFVRLSYRRMYLDGNYLTPTIGHENQERYGHSAVLSWNHTFSPSLINEFRSGATYHRNYYLLDVVGSDLVQDYGLKGITAKGIRNAPIFRIDPVSYMDWDDDDDSYYNNPSTAIQVIDNVSYTKGSHFFKFGFDAIRDRLNETKITSLIYGGYDFTGAYTGFGYADFLLGIPQTTQLAVPTPPRYLRGTSWNLFAQDQFKVTKRLTLNYGIRFEMPGSFSHQFGAIYSFDPAKGALVIPDNATSRVNPYFPKNVPIETATQAGYPADSLLTSRKANFRPRFGFAYKPFDSGQTVIRGGYGIYGNLVYREISRDMGNGPFAGSATFVNSMTNGVPLFSFPEPFLTSAIGAPGSQNVQGKNPNMRIPYTQQWNLTVEQQIADIGFRVSYVGSRTTNLIYTRNLNQLAPSTTAYNASRRPYPVYNRVIWADNGGNDVYNGLEMAAKRSQGKNLTYSGGYTWARDLTDTQDSGGGGSAYGGQVIQNQFDRRSERTNNGLMLKQRAFGYAIWVLPLGKGQRFLGKPNRVMDAVLGGWQTSWNVNLQSGQYFTPSFSSFDPSNTATFGGRPDRIGNGNLPAGQRTISHWFDTAAFKVPGCPDATPVCSSPANIGRFGNAGLFILEGPGIANLDGSLMKWFSVTERMRLQLRFIAVNALNHPNFSNPRSNISSRGTVGTVSSMARVLNGEPATREVNFGLRLEF